MQPWWLFFLYVCVYIYIYLYIFSGHVHVYAWDREGNADEGRGQVFRSIEQKEVSAVLVSQFINGPFNVANFNSVCVPLSDYPLCHPISYPPEANTLTLHRRLSVYVCVWGRRRERECGKRERVTVMTTCDWDRDVLLQATPFCPNICGGKTYLRAFVSQPICKLIVFMLLRINYIFFCEEIIYSLVFTINNFLSIFSTAVFFF